MTTSDGSRSLRRALRTLHLWIGVTLGIPLALIGVTGSILVFEDEIADFFDDAPKPVLAQGEVQSLAAIVAAARAHAPAEAQPALLALAGEGEPATVRFTRPGAAPAPGSAIVVEVDPVSLAVLPAREPSAAQNWLRQVFLFHANLSQGREGRIWVGWLGVVMCVLGLSGLVMWWPRPGRWKQAIVVARDARGPRLHRELHGATGFWGLIVFIMVSFSGVYIVFPETTGGLIRSVLPGRDLRAETASLRVQAPAVAQPIHLDRVVALAREKLPKLELRMVSFPVRPTMPYRVAFELPGTTPGHGVPMIAAFVDPFAGEVIAVQDPRSFTLGETVSAWQRPLHGGYGLGSVWQWLTFLSGLLPVLFATTGISMWWLRQRRKARDAAAKRVSSETVTE